MSFVPASPAHAAMLFSQQDLAALARQFENISEDLGAPAPYEDMARLEKLGLVWHTGDGEYDATAFGQYLMGVRAHTPLRTVKEESDAYAEGDLTVVALHPALAAPAGASLPTYAEIAALFSEEDASLLAIFAGAGRSRARSFSRASLDRWTELGLVYWTGVFGCKVTAVGRYMLGMPSVALQPLAERLAR